MSQNILITGALGFLGKFFVRGLLEQDPDLNLFLLVRGKGAESAEDRVRASGLLAPNVTAIAGDVTDENLPECAALLPPMDEIWHIAGLTTFHESKRQQLVRVNIHGTANMIVLAEQLQCKKYFHISTAYVAGICDGPVMEDELLPNPVFRNPYEETKYHGERLVRESNLPWIIIRPSIIMGHSETGEAESDKMIYGVVRAYHSLDSWVRRDYRTQGGPPANLRYHVRGSLATEKNAICVDDVVRLMFSVRKRGVLTRTYHCTHPKPIVIRDLHDITTKKLSIDYICIAPDFSGEKDPKQEFIHRAVRVYQHYMVRNDPVFDQQHALTLDGWHPTVLAGPRLETMLHRYLDGLRQQEEIAVGFLDTSLDLSRLSDVQKYGGFSLAHDTMSRQVNAFRVDGLSGYIAYATVKNTAIMVGDPVSGESSRLLHAFLTFCREHVLSFCGLQLSRNIALALRGSGLAVNKMGIETFIDLSVFDMELKGEEYKPIRRYRNAAKRHGIAFVERPVDLINPHEVLRVSDSWISRKKNRSELRLLLRSLSLIPEPGVRHCFIRKDARILGFVFFTPIYREEQIIGYTAGIERYDIEGTGLPANFNVMRYITSEFARSLQKEGIERIALGISPLYDIENSDCNDNPALVQLIQRVYDESELYAFQGIAWHKKQYPCRIEEPVYIATERDATEESVLDVFKGVGFLDT